MSSTSSSSSTAASAADSDCAENASVALVGIENTLLIDTTPNTNGVQSSSSVSNNSSNHKQSSSASSMHSGNSVANGKAKVPVNMNEPSAQLSPSSSSTASDVGVKLKRNVSTKVMNKSPAFSCKLSLVSYRVVNSVLALTHVRRCFSSVLSTTTKRETPNNMKSYIIDTSRRQGM